MPDSLEHIQVRKTYAQNWAAYNAAQTSEKDQFLKLLHELTWSVREPPKQTNGRPRIPIQDALFAVCFKTYSTLSARRFMTDLRDAKAKGFIESTPHFNSIYNYLENPKLTALLHAMILKSSLPLKAIEVDFAVDSSGFMSSRYSRWHDHKYGSQQQKQWVKLHLICGTKTNIVTAVEIKDQHAADTKLLPPLVEKTARNFCIREVSADKAYGSLKNYEAIYHHGGVPFIAFKKGSTGSKGGLWKRMYRYFRWNQAVFLKHYHKRSNVETTFSMIKSKFGGSVRSKTDVAMVNEVLSKIVAHNICVLIQEMHELGIKGEFK